METGAKEIGAVEEGAEGGTIRGGGAEMGVPERILEISWLILLLVIRPTRPVGIRLFAF